MPGLEAPERERIDWMALDIARLGFGLRQSPATACSMVLVVFLFAAAKLPAAKVAKAASVTAAASFPEFHGGSLSFAFAGGESYKKSRPQGLNQAFPIWI